jgi:hypothetical protein
MCKGTLWFTLFLFACAGYAYRVNAKRNPDDPKKKDFHPVAILLAPFTWPFILFGFISIFIIRAILYGVFLVLFIFALVFIRKPFLLIWLDKIARAIGDRLLEANTYLIKLFLRPWVENP